MDCALTVYLGLGSNLGNRLEHLRGGVEKLTLRGVTARRISSVFESRYVGPGGEQPSYLNLVLEGETALLPLDLLQVAQRIEAQHGRQPMSHLQPRPLDVDLLFYGGWIVRRPDLVIPHPRLHERRFVLEPLHELGVLRELSVPGLGSRLAHLQGQQELSWYCEWPIPGEARGTVQL